MEERWQGEVERKDGKVEREEGCKRRIVAAKLSVYLHYVRLGLGLG